MFETLGTSLISQSEAQVKNKTKTGRGTAVCQTVDGEDLMEKEISVANFQVSW